MIELRLEPELLVSLLSLLATCYFWLVRARKERPYLEFHQLSDFRASCRRVADRPDVKRLSLQQPGTGGVLIVNHSLRQNSVVLFECFLLTEKGLVEGDWGFVGDDRPPWNIGPETSIAFSPACFFDVPADYEMPDDPVFYLRFVTASGKRFTKRFSKKAKQLSSNTAPPLQQAA